MDFANAVQRRPKPSTTINVSQNQLTTHFYSEFHPEMSFRPFLAAHPLNRDLFGRFQPPVTKTRLWQNVCVLYGCYNRFGMLIAGSLAP